MAWTTAALPNLADIAKPGDFILFPMRPPIGWLIRFGQWLCGDGFQDFEHAAIYVGAGNMVEAMPGGARISRVDRYGKVPVVVSSESITLTDDQRALIVKAALGYQQARVGYSFLAYLAIAIHRFGWPVPLLRWYIGRTKHMICSQLVDRCYYDASVHLFKDDRWPGFVTPGDLYKLVR